MEPPNLNEIPHQPGCYLYKNSDGKLIYIGKAKDLKKRVSSYFTKSISEQKTQHLVSEIVSVDFIVTQNETEALILENNLIRLHKPKYNIDLRDARRYAYILLTDEEFPRLVTARDRTQKGEYFGPYTSAEQREQILKTLRMIFRIRTCRKLPKRACLRYHMHLCDAPCIGKISKESYDANIAKAVMYLKGKPDELITEIESEMKLYAGNQQFEAALRCRDALRALAYQKERQVMETHKKYNQDIINYVVEKNTVYLLVFNVSQGMLVNKKEFAFDYSSDFFEEFLLRYYEQHPIPKEIIVPEMQSEEFESDTLDTLAEYLSGKKNAIVQIIIPKKSERKELLELVKKNIEITFQEESLRLESLRTILKLEDTPAIIECFDISHLAGTQVVGAMVQFRNGRPDKSNYRRFKLGTDINDDCANIAEVVRRRYTRLIAEKSEFPNLIVIDGGQGQLSAALHEMEVLSLKIPIITLAKKFEEIYVPGLSYPIRPDKKNKGLLLLQHIRNEAHRFAITYQKVRRKKWMMG